MNTSVDKLALNKRIEAVGWGLFLIMIGGIALIPDNQVPNGLWLIGAGLIMIGVNVVRYLNQIKMSSFSLVLGIVALIAGLSDFAGVDLPMGPILLILIGASILFRMLVEKDR